MREYKVVALSLSGRNNRIFKSGDIVNEDNFPEGQAEQLVNQGFIEYRKTNDKEPSIQADPGEGQPELKVVEVKKFEEVTRAQIIERLTDKGVVFDKNSSKRDLYDLFY